MIYHYKEAPIFYHLAGQGPLVVLLHGFLESSLMWKVLASELQKTRNVLTIDLPGHGQSGSFSEVHTMEAMAEVVHEILKHLKLSNIELIGHSMGGYVGLALLEAYPKTVQKFVLLNSTTQGDSKEQKRNRDRAVKLISENKNTFVTRVLNILFVDASKKSFPNEIDQLKKEAILFSTEGIIAATLGMKVRKDRTSILKHFNREKIIICGNQDPVVPLEVSKSIAEATNSSLKVLGGGHMSWLENAEELIKLCT